MKNMLSILLSVCLMLTATLSVPFFAGTLTEYTITDVRSIEFVAARDIYPGESVEMGIGADVTFNDGEKFYLDLGYEYDYESFRDQAYLSDNIRYGLYNFARMKMNPAYASEQLGPVTVEIYLDLDLFVVDGKEISFDYNPTVTLNVVENPVASIEVIGDSPTVSLDNADKKYANIYDEATDTSTEVVYMAVNYYYPKDIRVNYTDGTSKLLSEIKRQSKGGSGWAFDGSSYSDFLNYDMPFEGAEHHRNPRQQVEYISNQAFDPWKAGNTYTVTVRYMYREATYQVKVAGSSSGSSSSDNGYEYKILKNGSAQITGYTGKDTELIIPSVLDGHPVSSIGDSAFQYCYKLTEVTIPSGVTSIGNDAFSDCNNLTDIHIPEGVVSIGSYAFGNCVKLTQIKLPDSLKNLGHSAFYQCFKLKNIVIPKGVTVIEMQLFLYCESLTEVTLPDGITTIGYARSEAVPHLPRSTFPKA